MELLFVCQASAKKIIIQRGERKLMRPDKESKKAI